MFLQKLRTQTAACHEALEQNPFSVALLSENVSAEAYSTYLKKLYGVVYGFEKNVFPILQSSLVDISERYKAPLILKDLSSDQLDISLIPDNIFQELYTTASAAWGGMYVLEGSTLGGQLIQKHLQKNLSDFSGSTYFTAYGAQTGSRWKEFLQQLSIAAQSPDWEEEIIESAIRTFEMINTWMTSETYIIAQSLGKK